MYAAHTPWMLLNINKYSKAWAYRCGYRYAGLRLSYFKLEVISIVRSSLGERETLVGLGYTVGPCAGLYKSVHEAAQPRGIFKQSKW